MTGTDAIFAGTGDTGQLAGVLVEGQSYVHRTAVGDTPALVAAILAAAIAPTRPATASGPVLSLPGATSVVARAVADASAALELRRQRQRFRISVWCPTPDLRDAACDTLDVTFAATPFLTLADGSAARLGYVSTTTFDQRQDAALYRRDVVYAVEYATTQVAIQPSMLFGALGLGSSVISA